MTIKKTIQYGRFTLECRVLNGKVHGIAFLNGRQILKSEAADTAHAPRPCQFRRPGDDRGDLAHAAGYEGFQAANSLYGALGKKVAQLAGLPFKKALASSGFVYTFALASGEQKKGEYWRWKMHPEVLEALRLLNRLEAPPRCSKAVPRAAAGPHTSARSG
jgi:hypothetical protein